MPRLLGTTPVRMPDLRVKTLMIHFQTLELDESKRKEEQDMRKEEEERRML